jgi:Domain of unknown function (DUF305)
VTDAAHTARHGGDFRLDWGLDPILSACLKAICWMVGSARSLPEERADAPMPVGSCMVVPMKLLAALGACGLAGAAVSVFFLGGLLLDQSWYPEETALGGARLDAWCSNGPTASEASFHTEMESVNARMHAGMRVAPSGNSDRDFARMMIAHHQGAIDMALVQLKYGSDERLKRLAQAIIAEQGQEISYIRNLLDRDPTRPVDQVSDR